jgi:cold shock CspA family protein
MTDNARMGDLFNQRRAAKKGGSQQRSSSSSATPSFSDIQAEQERNRGPPSRGSPRPSFRRGNSRGRRDYSHLDIEQGCISSLKDAFGFIYCADRPEELFFHYSQLQGIHSSELQVDDEVEFRVGPSERDADKMAAFEVKRLEPGTIEWEIEEEPGTRFQGLVERPVRSERPSSQMLEGTIRMLEVPDEGEATEEEIAAAATGPLIRYTANDYTPDEQQQEGNSRDFRRWDSSVSNSSRGRSRLDKNDLVEFTLVRERRTGNQMARSITLIQSERERQRVAKEKELLANATLEQGVVTSLKNDYGFLKSNRRRQEIYFHYSNVDLPDEDDDDEEDDESEHVLKEGQDMEFLVLTEPGRDGQGEKLSAREVKFLPKGTVEFEKLVAEGVTGVVTRPPHPADAGYASDMVGRVRLTEPLEDTTEDGTVKKVEEILFYSKDSPGGTFSANRDGSSVGLWVREGDSLIFDVVKDFVDGTLRVAPTIHKRPLAMQNSSGESKDDDASKADIKAVHLMAESLAGRAEGTVHAIKEGYGFISCAERPVDAYFRLYEVLPDHMQKDLRRNMGVETGEEIPQLKLGVQVQFDLSLQGIVAVGTHRSRNRLGGSSERENLKGQRLLLLPPDTFMENKVIATDAKGVISKEDQHQNYAGFIDLEETYQPMTYEERHPLVAKLIRSILEDDSPNQSPVVYHDVQSIHEDEVVVNMVEDLGKGVLTVTHIPVAGLSGHPGRLCISKLDTKRTGADGAADDDASKPMADEAAEITVETKESLTEEDAILDSSTHSLGQSGHSKRGKKKKRPKIKEINSVHYDKHSLSKELVQDIPPGKGDVILCDIVQSRRTASVTVTNVRVIERSETERQALNGDGDASKSSGVGIVTEVVAASKFGFISLLDENATRREMLFFQFSSIVDAPPLDSSLHSSQHSRRVAGPVKKGDEVKFDIVVGKKGKRTAINIHVVQRGTLNIPTRAEKNACQGFVLMEPSHTTLSNTPSRKASRAPVAKGNGRWENVESDLSVKTSSDSSVKEEGCILLISDPANMFAIRSSTNEETKDIEPAVSSEQEPENAPPQEGIIKEVEGANKDVTSIKSAVGTLVSYKNGAIAIHGAGASSSADGSGNPRRGDLVSFVKASRGGKGVRDIRVVERGAATLQRGRLEEIKLTPENSPGTAKFIAATEKEEEYDIELSEVVSCDISILKDKESVEGILHDGKVYGICRTSDLYLGSKLGSGHKERPKLNLTVRKELKKNMGGKIMAQSMMAKGPDGTNGFAAGWTSRVSQYAPPPKETVEESQEKEDLPLVSEDETAPATNGNEEALRVKESETVDSACSE